MTELTCHLKPYIQPFERILALKELTTLAGSAPIPQLDAPTSEPLAYRVITQQSPTYLANHLTYWERLYSSDNINQFTRQVKLEATTKNGFAPKQLSLYDNLALPTRRNLRYGTHGIHEYRGKFFPQLVRSLLNTAGVNAQSTILDPMCGSGTTPTESILLGCHAIGLDLNPLSVLISQAKCQILSISPDILMAEYKALTLACESNNSVHPISQVEQLSPEDQTYLLRWFAPQVLTDLDFINAQINHTQNSTCQLLFQVALSNIIRRVSWQKDDDLRIRKEIRLDQNLNVKAEFLDELQRSVKNISALLYENQGFRVGEATILNGDARQADQLLADQLGTIDAIVTSPPYATALPYLDTDRLSLCYFGLLPHTKHRHLNYEMIGNREISKKERQCYWEKYQKNRTKLPNDITVVIDLIEKLNQQADVGFRRRNLAALLGIYFLNMRQVFKTFLKLLKPAAPAYVVVGNNHTLAGGQPIEIKTDKLLTQLGESVGLIVEETIPMEMLVSRDVFKKNANNAETIIVFRNQS